MPSAGTPEGRVRYPLRELAQNWEVGPIPLAAAHAATGLHILLGVIAASQDAIATGDGDPRFAGRAVGGGPVRETLQNAMDNTDLLLNMLKSVGL